jgi:hypothetical protein
MRKDYLRLSCLFGPCASPKKNTATLPFRAALTILSCLRRVLSRRKPNIANRPTTSPAFRTFAGLPSTVTTAFDPKRSLGPFAACHSKFPLPRGRNAVVPIPWRFPIRLSKVLHRLAVASACSYSEPIPCRLLVVQGLIVNGKIAAGYIASPPSRLDRRTQLRCCQPHSAIAGDRSIHIGIMGVSSTIAAGQKEH